MFGSEGLDAQVPVHGYNWRARPKSAVMHGGSGYVNLHRIGDRVVKAETAFPTKSKIRRQQQDHAERFRRHLVFADSCSIGPPETLPGSDACLFVPENF